MSIIRPALISRSASLPMASIKAGVGPLVGCGEVMMDMKRMKYSCGLRVAGIRPAIPSRYKGNDDPAGAGSTRFSGKFAGILGRSVKLVVDARMAWASWLALS